MFELREMPRGHLTNWVDRFWPQSEQAAPHHEMIARQTSQVLTSADDRIIIIYVINARMRYTTKQMHLGSSVKHVGRKDIVQCKILGPVMQGDAARCCRIHIEVASSDDVCAT